MYYIYACMPSVSQRCLCDYGDTNWCVDGVISNIRIVSVTMEWSHLRGTKSFYIRGRNWVKIIGFFVIYFSRIYNWFVINFFFYLDCVQSFFYQNMWIVLKIFLFVRIYKLSECLAKCFPWYLGTTRQGMIW